MKIQLKYFGMIAEHVGMPEEEKEFAATNSDELKEVLESSYLILKSIPYRMAQNQEMIAQTVYLNEGDEIALLPPFAGG